MWKVNFENKSDAFHWEISVSCTMTQECDNVTLNTLLSSFLSIICQVVAYGKFKTKENFTLLPLKEVAVAYRRDSKCSDFGILENWPLRRGGPLREVVATAGSTYVGKNFLLNSPLTWTLSISILRSLCFSLRGTKRTVWDTGNEVEKLFGFVTHSFYFQSSWRTQTCF